VALLARGLGAASFWHEAERPLQDADLLSALRALPAMVLEQLTQRGVLDALIEPGRQELEEAIAVELFFASRSE
jgi:hypothetical protein